MSPTRRVALSHVGRIMETSEGTDSSKKCEACLRNGWGCRRYVETTENRLGSETWTGSRCAWCRFKNQGCVPPRQKQDLFRVSKRSSRRSRSGRKKKEEHLL